MSTMTRRAMTPRSLILGQPEGADDLCQRAIGRDTQYTLNVVNFS